MSNVASPPKTKLAPPHPPHPPPQEFTDAANTPTACAFHPGILFSGGQLNGAGLRFTCCNRRAHHIPNGSRDGNGCAAAFHAGGHSAWQRHGAVRLEGRVWVV